MLNESARLDLAFQALADPTRRGMLARLSLGPASVSELAKPLPMSLPAVLQHLQLLEASGLVRSEKVGEVAEEFDRVHGIERALAVGSVHRILPPERLRPYLIDAVERGMEKELARLCAAKAAAPPVLVEP